MFPQTHKLVALTAREALKEKTGIEIPLEPFLQGAVIPDSAPGLKLRGDRHYAVKKEAISQENNKTTSVVQWLENELVHLDYSNKPLNPMQLGILVHLASDSVSAAHNFKEYRRGISILSLPRHVAYEIAQDAKSLVGGKRILNDNVNRLISIDRPDDLLQHICKIHECYKKEAEGAGFRKTLDIDIREAVEVSYLLLLEMCEKRFNREQSFSLDRGLEEMKAPYEDKKKSRIPEALKGIISKAKEVFGFKSSNKGEITNCTNNQEENSEAKVHKIESKSKNAPFESKSKSKAVPFPRHTCREDRDRNSRDGR